LSPRTLRSLTGLRIPNDHLRWSYWWKATEGRVVTELMDVLETDAETLDEVTPRERFALRKLGWVQMQTLEQTLAQWLHATDDLLRQEACILAAHHRLADLGPSIERTKLFASDVGLSNAAAEALRVLGVPE
jgi:hypothetical protein